MVISRMKVMRDVRVDVLWLPAALLALAAPVDCLGPSLAPG